MENRDKHLQDFFAYVAANADELRHCLRKNITYDPEIFDDVTADTVCRIGEYIANKGLVVENFKSLFFLAAKRQYISEQNKRRNRLKNSSNDFFEILFDGDTKRRYTQQELDFINGLVDDSDEVIERSESKARRINEFYRWLNDYLNEHFLPVETDIFIIYYRLKSEKNGVSYKKLANILQVPVKFITDTIVKIKKFVKSDETIREMKNKMIDKNDE